MKVSKRATTGLYSGRSDPCIWVRVHTCKLSCSGKYPPAAYIQLQAVYEFSLCLVCLLCCLPASQPASCLLIPRQSKPKQLTI
ncbi:hypothetical protein M747DRAFT_151268 [Aspergillus niger ATCC 13496]|uniref:Uncharacterized protein n=1 Tax=Aspergillus niger ATCC 13496 TaxID=1353008 RepID=A0A370C6M4_ASPNG|nr:hypothetical protein M747DRAFT_151268 [Aspergillus niger ATCC 13496]